MQPDRPFSGPVSVGLAGLALAGLAAWSFGLGLTHELRLSRTEVPPARVLVSPSKPPPPPPASANLAYSAALRPEPPPPAHRPHRHARPDSSTPLLQNLPPPAAEAAAAEAAATAPDEPSPTPPPDAPSDPDTASPPTP